MLTQEQKDLVKATVPILRENGIMLTQYFYNRMLTNNPKLKETFNMGHQRSGAQSKALAGAVLAYAENIDDPSALSPVVELICNKHVSLNIQAHEYDIVGENLLCSISEVLNVSKDDPLFKAWEVAYQQLADLFIDEEAKLYTKQASEKGGWLGWRNFIVDKKVKESDEITSFYLVPEDGKMLPDYKPGQYISLKVFIPELGIKQPRQYSLSDTSNGKYFRISVKHEVSNMQNQSDGYVSSVLHQNTNIGDRVELTAPIGNFFLVNPNKNNVMISAGVGITPMVAMVNHLAALRTTSSIDEPNNKKTNDIYFIHAARNSDVQGIRNEVKDLAKDNNNIHLYFINEQLKDTDVKGQDYHFTGRLDLNEIPASFLTSDSDYYLCGPIPFMKMQYESLINLGVKSENIYSEAFGTGGVGL